jgi:hypothetical protein
MLKFIVLSITFARSLDCKPLLDCSTVISLSETADKYFIIGIICFCRCFLGLRLHGPQRYLYGKQNLCFPTNLVDSHESSKNNSIQLGALQGFEQTILKRHKRFTDSKSCKIIESILKYKNGF